MKLFILATIMTIASLGMQAQKQDPWMEYMMPSAVHEMLGRYTGNFTMEISMWMTASQDPQVVKVKSTNRMILGGRFLEMTQTGKMAGMDYNAITTIGYNNSDKKIALTTITNMGTGILSLTGSWNEKTELIQLTGTMTNPVTKKPIRVRQTVSFPDKDTLLIENFDKEEGAKERKSIQYRFTRALEN